MSNPFSIGSVTNLPNGPGQATDNITAIGNSTAYGLGALDNHTALPYDIIIPPIKIKSGSTATGTCSLYVITSEDNVVWTDGIDPAAHTDQTAKIITATVAAVINVGATATTYYFPEIDIPALLGYIPLYCAIVLRNQSGAALATGSTNFSANSLTISYT